MNAVDKLPIVILISGSGSNLEAIIKESQNLNSAFFVSCVISNKADAYGLTRAEQAGITTRTVDHKAFSSREQFDQALVDTITPFKPKLLILAGFMRILTPVFIDHFQGKLINIHPSLLPDYRGLNTHARVIEDKKPLHGCSIHYVTAELDGGPVIAQATVPVLADDLPDSLAKRVQKQEHRLYPMVIRWLASQQIELSDGQVKISSHVSDEIAQLGGETIRLC